MEVIKISINLNLFHKLHQISRLLSKEYNKALQPFDLYSAQWSVIFALKNKGIKTQKELGDYLGVEAPPLTRNIQRLVKKGLVRQVSGEDRRFKMIELTEKAHVEYPKWEKVITNTKQRLMENFPKESEEQLDQLLEEWLSSIPSN